jgi:site-specific DNA-adenine methylase
MIRPILKIRKSRFQLVNWVLQHLPTDQNYDLVFPFCGSCDILLNKETASGMEAVNDPDPSVGIILRSLRDEPERFINKIKNTTFSERVFNREKGKVYEDPHDMSINEFIVRKLSKNGLKETFDESAEPSWEEAIQNLPSVSTRLSQVFVFSKNVLDFVFAFDNKDTVCVVEPPPVSEGLAATSTNEMSPDDHIALSEYLHRYRGKVIVSAQFDLFYKRLYKGWRCTKKEYDGRKPEALWMNWK